MSNVGTFFDPSNPVAMQHWNKRLNLQHADKTHNILKLGSGYAGIVPRKQEATKAICYDIDMEGGFGDNVTHHYMFQMQHRGASGRERLQGKEGGQVVKTWNYRIDKFRGGIRNSDTMNQQRVAFRIGESQVSLLSYWTSRRTWNQAINHLTGYLGTPSAAYTDHTLAMIDVADAGVWNGNNAILPTADKSIFRPGAATTDEAVAALGLGAGGPTLDRLLEMTAKLADDRIKLRPPIRVDDIEMWPFLVSTSFMRELKKDPRVQAIHNAILGNSARDPGRSVYFTGSNFSWDQMLFIVTDSIPPGFDSTTFVPIPTTSRCVLLGTEALCIAYGRGYSPSTPYVMITGTDDGEAERYWHAVTHFGMSRPQIFDPFADEVVDTGTLVSTWFTG